MLDHLSKAAESFAPAASRIHALTELLVNWTHRLGQLGLPPSIPILQLLFATDPISNGFVQLDFNQSLHTEYLCDSRTRTITILVFPDSLREIEAYTEV